MRLKDLLEKTTGSGGSNFDKGDVQNGELIEDLTGTRHYGNFWAINIGLKTFKGFPKIIDNNLDVMSNPITSLDFAPEQVGGYVDLSGTEIHSLQGIGKKVFKEIEGYLYFQGTFIPTHLLGLFLVRNLKGLNLLDKGENDKDKRGIENIINHHLVEGGRDILDCQEELIQHGFKEFAKL